MTTKPDLHQRLTDLEKGLAELQRRFTYGRPRTIRSRPDQPVFYPGEVGQINLRWYTQMGSEPNVEELANVLKERWPNVDWTVSNEPHFINRIW